VLSLSHPQRCSFLILEQSCGPLAVEIFPGKQENTAISANILPRVRELSLAHAQRCSFLIIKECFGPKAVEIILGKHCDFSTYLAKRTRGQSGACAEVQDPDYGTELWSPCSRHCSRKHFDFSTYLEREREISLAHAQRCSFQIMEECCGPLVVEMIRGNTAISVPILPRERELSLAHAQRCSFLIMDQSCSPMVVE
jgi:hypothetical protein